MSVVFQRCERRKVGGREVRQSRRHATCGRTEEKISIAREFVEVTHGGDEVAGLQGVN